MRSFLLAIFLSFSTFLVAQSRQIKGKVIDFSTNKGLEGLQVLVIHVHISTTTDRDGNFILSIPDTLHKISFLVPGYQIKREENTDGFYRLYVVRDIFSLSLHQLMNLQVVSTSKKSEKLVFSPAAVEIFTSKNMEVLNYSRLIDYLEFATGMSSVNGEGNFFYTTTIRGNTRVNYNTNTLLLYNGIKIYNPYHGSFDFQAIPISSIKQIEIVKGSNSVLYGTNAINAVINIITRDQGIKGNYNDAGARVQVGDYNSAGTNFYLISQNDEIKFTIYSDLYSTRGEKLTYEDEQDHILTYNRSYLGYNVATSLTYRDFRLDFLTYRRREPVVRTRGFEMVYSSQDDTIGHPVPEVNDEQMYIGNLTYNKTINSEVSVHFQSEVLKWNNTKYLVDGQWIYSSFGNYNILELSTPTQKHFTHLLGVSLNNYIGRRFKTQINDYDIGKDNLFTHEFSAYYNGSAYFFDRLWLHYGLRFVLSKYKRTFHDLSPRMAIVYKVDPYSSIKLIYGQSFRVPTYFEKEVHSDKVIGNPYLEPEKSTSFDLVVYRAKKHKQYNLDFFYTRIRNQIERVVSPNDPDKRINLNVGNNIYRGVEISSMHNFSNIYVFAGYSFVMSNNEATGQPLEFTYHHMVDLGMILKPFHWLGLKASYKYLSHWGPAPAYNLINLALSLKGKAMPLDIELRVNNVLGTHILLPEIARDGMTIPKTEHRMLFMTVSYNFFK